VKSMTGVGRDVACKSAVARARRCRTGGSICGGREGDGLVALSLHSAVFQKALHEPDLTVRVEVTVAYHPAALYRVGPERDH